MRAASIEEVNGFTLNEAWDTVIYEYGIPFIEYCLSISYAIYMGLTFINVTVLVLKYVPSGFYLYKFIKDVYLRSRERKNQREIEMDDIQLQISIVNTKLHFRNAEFYEREEQLRRFAQRLRKVRSRVHYVIASDEGLRHAFVTAAQWDADHEIQLNTTSKEQDRELVRELITEYWTANDNVSRKDCSEHAQADTNTPERSVFSSLSNLDVRQDCRVKIVKVTNVYKVAYLKHFIKQRRLRRATKQALLKKKMENIKTLFEDWQKTLNMVLNNKLTILKIDSDTVEVASQDVIGDYTKPNGSSGSDSDLNWTDSGYDEYNQSWASNQYKPHTCSYEGVPGTTVTNECYESQEYGDGRYSYCKRIKGSNMMSVIEETNSQIAIEESQSEANEHHECRECSES